MVEITIDSAPIGQSVLVNGLPRTLPYTLDTLAGHLVKLAAPATWYDRDLIMEDWRLPGTGNDTMVADTTTPSRVQPQRWRKGLVLTARRQSCRIEQNWTPSASQQPQQLCLRAPPEQL